MNTQMNLLIIIIRGGVNETKQLHDAAARLWVR